MAAFGNSGAAFKISFNFNTMTNKEYKNLAIKILEETDNLGNDNYTITNISDLFFFKLRKALLKYERKESSYTIAKELKRLQNVTDESDNVSTTKESDFNVSIYSEPVNIDEDLAKLSYFRILQFAVNSLPNVECVFSGYGVENPKKIIQKIKSVHVVNTPKSQKIVNAIIKEFKKNEKLGEHFSSFSFYFFIKKMIFHLLRIIPEKEFVQLFEQVQYVVAHYKELYSERIAIYSNILDSLDEYWNLHGNAIIRILSRFSSMCREQGFHKVSDLDVEDLEELSISPAIGLDIYFLLYYLLYESFVPISLTFYLMSDNMPLYLKNSIIECFKEDKYYAPIIQYEFECYCLKNKVYTAFPKLFYSGASVDLNSFGIIDYDLYISDIEIPSQEKNNSDEPVKNDNSHLVQIVHELERYFVSFDGRNSIKKGSLFIRDYLSPVIKLSEKLSKSLSVYGFAYILYNSRYFKWEVEKFDDSFVYKIAQIFNIEHKLGTKYPENKAKKKAYDMLEKEICLQGLWDESTRKVLTPSKK